MTDYFLGADPGGLTRNGFGWALLPIASIPPNGGQVVVTRVGTAIHAAEAWERIKGCIGDNDSILAVGIDAPIGLDATHDRRIDMHIRSYLRTGPITVNGLYGACVAQGMAFGLMVNAYGILRTTESYPSAVHYFAPWTKGVSCPLHAQGAAAGCDQCDASAAALSAWAMVSAAPGWMDWHTIIPRPGAAPLKPTYSSVPSHQYWLPLHSEQSVSIPG